VFRHGLIERILLLGARRRDATRPRAGEGLPPLPAIGRRTRHQPGAEIALRPFANAAPRVLVIGASTGGPQALTRLLGDLGETIDRAPVLITQHMPPTFTTILAEHLARASGRPVREAEDGEPVRAGRVYLAPGGRHMRVRRQDGTAVIALDDGPPINFCKPAVDPLFASAAATWKSWVLGLVLTGMGSDGTFGAGEIVNAGGNMIVQDEASSAIWGMPGAVAQSGLASAMLPLDQIAAKVERLFLGDRP
jgi:two-component system chemotaxis response regulator CheB